MKAYLRGLADEFGESTNAIRLELNHLEEAGLLTSQTEGNKKVYQANPGHPLFNDIRNLVLKHSGIYQIIDEIVSRTGDIQRIWIRGSLAEGKDSNMIDMLIVGQNINIDYFTSLIEKVKELVQRDINYNIIPQKEEKIYLVSEEKKLLVWETSTLKPFI